MSLGFRTTLFSPLVPDGSGAERVATGMAYRFRAVKPWDAGAAAGAMETQWSAWFVVNGTAITVDLPITPAGNGLDVEIQTRIGTDSGRPETRMETVAIPTGTGTIDYYNTVPADGPVLVRLIRSTLTAIPAPPSDTVQAQIDALNARMDSLSGGATTLVGITDMSPYMRTVNDDTTATAARTTLSAAAATHTHVATADLTATGTKDTTTYLRGDNTWATPTGTPGAIDAYTDISGLPGYPATFPPTLPIAQSGVTGLVAALAAATPDLSLYVLKAAAALTGTPTTSIPVAGANSAQIAPTSFVQDNTAWAYGIQPRVVWSGTAWPTRSARTPTGYTGAVEYWSPYDSAATAPTDRLVNDLWTRKRVA